MFIPDLDLPHLHIVHACKQRLQTDRNVVLPKTLGFEMGFESFGPEFVEFAVRLAGEWDLPGVAESAAAMHCAYVDEDLVAEQPSDEVYAEAEQFCIEDAFKLETDLNVWRTALAEGHPIIFGCNLFTSFEQGRRGKVEGRRFLHVMILLIPALDLKNQLF